MPKSKPADVTKTLALSRTIAADDFPVQEVKWRVKNHGTRPNFKHFSKSPNVALMWSRYMPGHVCFQKYEDWDCLTLAPNGEFSRKEAYESWSGNGALHWFCTAAKFPHPDPKWKQLHERREQTLKKLCGSETLTFLESKTQWRAAVGLGSASTFENSGVTLHSTYGFPILPASSLKGVARHFLFEDPELSLLTAADCGIADDDFKALPHGEQLADLLFGRRDGAGDEETDHVAAIRLFDGWPTGKPSSGWFDVDVLTVHHPEYYKANQAKYQFAVDSEGPNPVHFLTLAPDLEFSIPLSLTAYGTSLTAPDPQPAACVKVARSILAAALRYLGVGAKTAGGFGRMLETNP